MPDPSSPVQPARLRRAVKRPLSVVGTDQEALRALLALHACPEPRILDVTHNRGRMWKGLPYRPHRSDRDASLHEQGFTDTVADFRALPFEDGSFDVIVFDPPHLTHGGGVGVMREWRSRFGLGDEYAGGLSLEDTFEPFLEQAQRVLTVPTGVVLAKIADQVHGQRHRWQARAFQNMAEATGWTCCDLMLKVHYEHGVLNDPRWKLVQHTRQVHSYWIVLRNGPDCFSPTAPAADVKPRTGEMFAEIEFV